MIDRGKKNLLGVLVDAVDYEAAVKRIVDAAVERRPLGVSALAVHGVMMGYSNDEHRARLNQLDLVVPDGQPVRWALDFLHRTGLPGRVYGPTLMLKLCQRAEERSFPIYLYGSTPSVLERLEHSLSDHFPKLPIAGAEPSRFRQLSAREKAEVVDRIKASGARLTFVGLGCPRQEVWVYEYRPVLSMPLLAVGAAFDFHAGALQQAPHWMQDRGLEWLFRLKIEPRRLWRRYVLLNPMYVALVAAQFLGIRRFSPEISRPIRELSYG
jgi:exopolysaccharide biosynthesis WecB/TagA/CpsF family protein